MERLTHKRNNGIKEGYWSPNKKEELALNIMCPHDSDTNCNEKSCYTCCLKWLQQEG